MERTVHGIYWKLCQVLAYTLIQKELISNEIMNFVLTEHFTLIMQYLLIAVPLQSTDSLSNLWFTKLYS